MKKKREKIPLFILKFMLNEGRAITDKTIKTNASNEIIQAKKP